MNSKIFSEAIISLSSDQFYIDLLQNKSIAIIEDNGKYVCLLKNDIDKTIEYFCPILSPIHEIIKNTINEKYLEYTIINNNNKCQYSEKNTSFKHCVLRCIYFLQNMDNNHFHMINHLSTKTKLNYDELVEKLVIDN